VKKLKVTRLIKENLTSRETVDLHEQLVKAVNSIEFRDAKNKILGNLNGAWATGITPGVINTDFALVHNLGRVPTGWFPVWKDGYVDFKIGAGTWTSKQIFLQASVANVNYRIFVF
jgi:hypothetical protein